MRVPPGDMEQLHPQTCEGDPVPQLGEAEGHEGRPLVIGTFKGDFGTVGEHVGHHQPGDKPQEDPGVDVQGHPLGPPDEALPGRHEHSHDDQYVEGIHHRPPAYRVDIAQRTLQADILVDAVEEEVDGAHLEDDEPPEDEEVQGAGVPVFAPRYPGVAQHEGNEAQRPPDRLGEAIDPLAAREPTEAYAGRIDEEGYETEEGDRVEDVAGKFSGRCHVTS